MTTLKRTARKTYVPGTPAIPAVPAWFEYKADPSLESSVSQGQTTTIKRALPFATSGGGQSTPASGVVPAQTSQQTGGSMTSSAGYYTATSYNGVPGAYVMIANSDGTYKVVRV